MPKATVALHTDDIEVSALGHFCHVETAAMPSLFSAELLEENKLIVLDQLRAPGQYGDAFGWREAISSLERDWFAPLLTHLRWHPSAVRFVDPVNGKVQDVTTADVWKIWQRPRR